MDGGLDQGQGRGTRFNNEEVANPTTPENLLFTNVRGMYLMKELMNEVSFENGFRRHPTSGRAFEEVRHACEVGICIEFDFGTHLRCRGSGLNIANREWLFRLSSKGETDRITQSSAVQICPPQP